MAKKKNKFPFSISYDAPVTLTFSLVTIFFFILDSLILKHKLASVFLASPTAISGELPFELKNFLSYLRVIFYSFGGSNPVLVFSNLIFILLLGPDIEEKYGSIIIGIMIFVSGIFAGVLNSCFCAKSLTGATAIVFMMIFLNAFMSFSKKKIPCSFVVVFALYITIQLQLSSKPVAALVPLLINIAGGLCGSLFAFLTSPKSKAVRKASGLKAKAEVLAEFDDENSPRFKKGNTKKEETDDDDETIVGTLKF